MLQLDARNAKTLYTLLEKLQRQMRFICRECFRHRFDKYRIIRGDAQAGSFEQLALDFEIKRCSQCAQLIVGGRAQIRVRGAQI